MTPSSSFSSRRRMLIMIFAIVVVMSIVYVVSLAAVRQQLQSLQRQLQSQSFEQEHRAREHARIISDKDVELEYARERITMLGHLASAHIKQLLAAKQPPLTQSNMVRIALIIPITSKGFDKSQWREMPLFKAFLPSLLRTAERGYHYTLFFGANEGDPFFDTTTAAAAAAAASTSLQSLFAEAVASVDMSSSQSFVVDYVTVLAAKEITGSKSLSILFADPTWAAYHAGYDYFYLLNDDLEISSKRWTSDFINALRKNPIYPNLGVAGAVDTSTP